jgi:hypothetical protein
VLVGPAGLKVGGRRKRYLPGAFQGLAFPDHTTLSPPTFAARPDGPDDRRPDDPVAARRLGVEGLWQDGPCRTALGDPSAEGPPEAADYNTGTNAKRGRVEGLLEWEWS